MASGSRKRRAARSPSHSTPVRKIHRGSTSTSTITQRDSLDPHLNRAKSVFRGQSDPYFPPNGGNATLPTSDDYIFRIQVLSTTTNLDTNVFKKAVQGLVKICFPHNVLEELGIEVVTQHMRNEHAPEHNIAKMAEIFRSEMIHRVTWMLAEHLDSPLKVESSVKAIMAASASLHGARIGDDVLDDIIASLAKLKERIPNNSAALLADNIDIEVSASNVAQSDTPDSEVEHDTRKRHRDKDRFAVVATESSSDEHATPTLSASEKAKKSLRTTPIPQAQNVESNLVRIGEGSLQPEKPLTIEPSREGKEGRVSTSWRWNVPETISIEDATEHFKRTSDLFAYHALPVAKQRLGSQAKRKEIRQNIEAMLAAMPFEEYEKWVESFRKLENGDMSMLERPPPRHRSQQHTASATPAPVTRQSESGSALKSASSLVIQAPSRELTKLVEQHPVKQEQNTDQNHMRAHTTSLGAFGAGTVATTGQSGQLVPITNSTFESVDHENQLDAQTIVTNKGEATTIDTPIVDLFWGQSEFGEHDCAAVAQSVMKSLDSRVSVESVGLTRFDGTTIVQTKKDLQTLLLGLGAKSSSVFSDRGIRVALERKLQPWVIANLACFSEFRTSSFVFVNIMPNLSTVVDLFFDPSTNLNNISNEAIRDRLVERFKARGLFKGRERSLNMERIAQEVLRLLRDVGRSDIYMRCLLEKLLRRIAFAHQPKFLDLKFSPLVKTWQRATKQRW